MKKISVSLKSIDPLIEKIEKISKVQRILIYCGTFLVLIGVFTYCSYFPKFRTIDKLNTQYEALEKKLVAAKKKAAKLEMSRRAMKEAEVQFKVAKNKLPEKKEIPSLLAAISQSGQDAGLEFLLFQPKGERMKDFYAEIPVSLKVTGNYHNIALFFDKVANLSRIVNVRNIALSPPKKGDKLSASFSAVTYRFVEASQKKASKDKKSKRKKKKR